MKVLHITESAHPSYGGPIEVIRQLATVSEKAGVQMAVASLDPPDAPYLRQFPFPLFALGLAPATRRYKFNRHFVSWLRAHAGAYDGIVLHGLWAYHSVGTWWALRSLGIPYVLYTHGMLDPWFKQAYPLKHLKKSIYWPLAEYRVLRDAKAVLFTAEDEKVLARQSFWPYHCNEVVTAYGTSGPPCDSGVASTAFFEKFPGLIGKRLLVFVGRIHPKKGCDLLIRAFANAVNDEKVQLVMVGPDQVGWQPELMQLANALGISKRVTWTGMLSGDAKWGAYYSADAFILPSHSENFGVVVAEALACGTPALISNRVNIWREVKQDGAGLVCSDDLCSATGMIEQWMSMNDDAKGEMRRLARPCFLRRFEINAAAQRLHDVIEGSVSGLQRF